MVCGLFREASTLVSLWEHALDCQVCEEEVCDFFRAISQHPVLSMWVSTSA